MADTARLAVSPVRLAHKANPDGIAMYLALRTLRLQKETNPTIFVVRSGPELIRTRWIPPKMALTDTGGDLRVKMPHSETITEGPIENIEGNPPIVDRCQILKTTPIPHRTRGTAPDLVQ
jgi:hypothetical protein